MSLEFLFSRLAVRPTTTTTSQICRQCRRRGVATVPPRATASLSQSLQSSREQQQSPSARQTSTSRPARSTYDIASSAITESTTKTTLYQQSQAQRDLTRGYTANDLSRQVSRKWKTGDVYSPHDLSGPEMAKWKKLRRKPRPKYDVLDQLGMNPLHYYKNFSIMSEYITDMGRIRGGLDTGLRPVNQRKMAKAVRRAMGMGLMPGVHRHPELLRREHKI
ncbi:uncharacterized protein RCC_11409 [Ramularia collo-cygni]|uniref:Small ribosomal subunit protein bS18m n=1 Tax=Ramularia collo-cygni TaxID=112498 RepID=A0A2D3VHV8_9PEZI|nr:uncharacterized protein RCC_11409 [Ramularia collo-cygni]CZT25740.1 uncharacterized protein RCC_11409 [Ramularia collo-cygni]